MLYFRILSQDMNCVAAIGVVHFSVRGFGCALFYFRKEYKNMKVKKFSAVATAVALLISMTACAGTGNEQASSADKSTSDITDSAPSSVDESSDTATQSKEETTVSTESTTAATTSAASKEETTAGTENTTAATTPAASVEESSDTVTESKAETPASTADTTAESPATEAPATTKAETIAPTLSKNERYVYDEDGNVVDKIKVKVVDGVTYTVGEKSGDKCILDGVPLFTNDPEFPSGDIITMTQIAICRRGFNISQQEIFEKYVKYHTPDEWYEEDGVSYGPMLGGEYLNYDPRLEPQKFFNGFLFQVKEFCKLYFKNTGEKFPNIMGAIQGNNAIDRIRKAVNDDYLVILLMSDSGYGYEKLGWVVKEEGGMLKTQGLHSNYRNLISIGVNDDYCILYRVSDGSIFALSNADIIFEMLTA